MPPGIGNKHAQQLWLARKKLAEKRKEARTRENLQSGSRAQSEVPLSESLLRRVDVEDDDSNNDHPAGLGDSHASENEDSGSDDSDSEVEMTDAEDLDLEEAVFDKNAFETLLMGSQQPGVFEEATFLYQHCPDPSLRTV